MASRGVVVAAAVGALVGAVVGCKSSVDPDQGRFSCTADGDCGDGFQCVPRFDKGAFCFKKGTCVAETCTGLDDNCNGAVDDNLPEVGTACSTGLKGDCAMGAKACDGGIVCIPQALPGPELCNGRDDDCDGLTDEDFDLQTDSRHCGTCDTVCGTGNACLAGTCREARCDDGVDNDNSGGADCADPACLARACGPADGGFRCGLGDGGSPDAGAGDAGERDAGEVDAGGVDAGGVDAGELDAGASDAGDADAGLGDAGEPDAGNDAGLLLPPGCFPG